MEDQEFHLDNNKLVAAQLDLLIDILSRIKTLENRFIETKANELNREVSELSTLYENEKEEMRLSLCEYLYEKFGPDLSSFLKK